MGVAHPPKKLADKSHTPEVHLQMVDHLAKGIELDDLVKKVYPPGAFKNPKTTARRRRLLRRRILNMIATSEEIQGYIANQSKAIMMAALPAVSQRLADRAIRRGEPQAVKLLFEATGFYNPRVKHEHSGDIEIKLTMPRPEPAGLPSGPKTVEGEGRPQAGRKAGRPTRQARKEAG
jgi:hypothetical protein